MRPARRNTLILHPNGHIRVVGERSQLTDLYLRLLSLQWHQFFLLYGFGFILTNVFFGALYAMLPLTQFDGMVSPEHTIEHYFECFFFSVQTLGTIGYGKISPVGIAANTLVTIETMFDLASIAVVTGLVFSRFSRPSVRVVFSKNALMTKNEGMPSFVFRIANKRSSRVVEARVHVVLIRSETTLEGDKFRRLHDLKLRRDNSPIFAMSWTVVHHIDENSPLQGVTPEMLRDGQAQFVITFAGTEETLSQSVYARYTYNAEDVLFGHRFTDIMQIQPDGHVHLDLEGIHGVKPA